MFTTFQSLTFATVAAIAFVMITRTTVNTSFNFFLPWEDGASIWAHFAEESSSHAKLKVNKCHFITRKVSIMIESYLAVILNYMFLESDDDLLNSFCEDVVLCVNEICHAPNVNVFSPVSWNLLAISLFLLR